MATEPANSQPLQLTIRQAVSSDATRMQSGFDANMGWRKPRGYFEHMIGLQEKGDLILLVAYLPEEEYAGHCKVVWKPRYPPYREQGIPEIQDLNVLPKYQRNGIASRLVDVAEDLIRERSPIAGIRFGLYADYGPAQRMYVLRGYVPDGQGISYMSKPVEAGERVRVDDMLTLALIRRLEP
jgi:GNAT superfamily N-acetyltransferase